MPRVATKDRADHPVGMEEEGWVREIDFLPSPPRDPFARGSFAGDFRIQPGQPRRHCIRGGAKDDGDDPPRGPGENRLEPVQIELAVLRFPGRPDRLTDSDDREVRLLHEIEIDIQPVIRLVLVVVSRTEQHAVGTGRNGTTPLVVHCPGHSLTLRAVRPDCQKCCKRRKAASSGTTASSELEPADPEPAGDPDDWLPVELELLLRAAVRKPLTATATAAPRHRLLVSCRIAESSFESCYAKSGRTCPGRASPIGVLPIVFGVPGGGWRKRFSVRGAN